MIEDCTLCPRQCHAKRDGISGNGFCQLPCEMKIGRIAPHLWEEPPISGKKGTGAVFFSGCTMRCVYCQNAQISHRNEGVIFTPKHLAEKLKMLVDMGMETISFITATPFVPKILETMNIYHPPIPIVWNTSGYETPETLKMLDGVVDVYLPDFKHASEKMGQLCAKAPDYNRIACKAISEMVRQTGEPKYNENGIMLKGTLIRHLILPGLTGESIQLLQWIRNNLPPWVPVSLMRQYTPMNNVSIPGLDRKITTREYNRVKNAMEAMNIPGFLQESVSASEDFVPSFCTKESGVMEE